MYAKAFNNLGEVKVSAIFTGTKLKTVPSKPYPILVLSRWFEGFNIIISDNLQNNGNLDIISYYLECDTTKYLVADN